MPLTYNPYAKKAMSTKTGVNPETGLPWGMGPGQGYTGEYVLPGSSTPTGPGGTPTPPGGGAQRKQNPYADLINNMLNQQRADIGADSAADKASRDAAIRRLIISYGEAPDLESLGISGAAKGVLGGVMNDQTRALSAQNTAEGTSVKARLGQAFNIAQRQVGQGNASRGTLRSGDTGYKLEQVGMQDKQTRFDTLNEMLGNVEGAVGSYAAAERMRQRQLAEAEMQAAWQLSQLWDDSDLGGQQPGGSDLSSMYPPGGPTAGNGPYGGVTDPYWQNLIDYYESAAGTVPYNPKRPSRGSRGGRGDTGTRGGGV